MCLGSCHCFPQATCEANSLLKSGNKILPSYCTKTRASETNNRKHTWGKHHVCCRECPAQATWRVMRPLSQGGPQSSLAGRNNEAGGTSEPWLSHPQHMLHQQRRWLRPRSSDPEGPSPEARVPRWPSDKFTAKARCLQGRQGGWKEEAREPEMERGRKRF